MTQAGTGDQAYRSARPGGVDRVGHHRRLRRRCRRRRGLLGTDPPGSAAAQAMTTPAPSTGGADPGGRAQLDESCLRALTAAQDIAAPSTTSAPPQRLWTPLSWTR